MRSLAIAIVLLSIFSPGAYSQEPSFDLATKTGTLGNLDAGAILTNYINPPVQNTYKFINPKDVTFQKEHPEDVVNVEKMEAFGQIITNP